MVPNYASFSRRGLAYFVDALILLPVCAIGNQIIPILGAAIVMFFYAPLMEASELRATIGKHLAGIQVVDLQGRQISLQAALVRNVMKFISFGLLCVGFIFALFTEKSQSLHDLLSDTLVVYGRSDRSIRQAWKESARNFLNQISSKNTADVSSTPESVVSQLERLQALREKGALTEEEFLVQKRKILKLAHMSVDDL